MKQTTQRGRIVASYGHYHLLNNEKENTKLIQCFSRNKVANIVVGDTVEYRTTSINQAVIVNRLPRFNQVERSNKSKQKILAANIDQIVILVATEPLINEDLLNRILIEAEYKKIKTLILLNKNDIKDKLYIAKQRLSDIKNIGYLVVETSLKREHEQKHDADLEIKKKLLPHFINRTSLLIGQSGVGKSTLTNLLIPEAKAKTQSISKSLMTGKHTTSLTRLFNLAVPGSLIDSPGFQEFSLHHIKKTELSCAFKEFRQTLTHCRFHNCLHHQEPGCAVIQSVLDGNVSPSRYSLYKRILTSKD